MDTRLLLQGGTTLVQRSKDAPAWTVGDMHISGSRIAHVGAHRVRDVGAGASVVDASGLLVLPAIVDLHGDAFERQIQPRPDAVFSPEIALADTDRQLAANGITTACHGISYSWEGGLRGKEAAQGIMEHMVALRRHACVDHRVHLRFEVFNVNGVPDVLRWMGQGRIDFLSFADHMPAIQAAMRSNEQLVSYAGRARCTPQVLIERIEASLALRDRVDEAIADLAAACMRHNIPMASHDDRSARERERYNEAGASISEFPRTQDALFAAMTHDNRVVMGAPNVLLGGSRSGGLRTSDAVRSRMCDVLVSDYYYPSLLQAPFRLAHEGACSLAEAWQLVSTNPAHMLGLADRGRLFEGGRADLLLVEALPNGSARLIATIADGRLVYCADPDRLLVARAYTMAA